MVRASLPRQVSFKFYPANVLVSIMQEKTLSRQVFAMIGRTANPCPFFLLEELPYCRDRVSKLYYKTIGKYKVPENKQFNNFWNASSVLFVKEILGAQ